MALLYVILALLIVTALAVLISNHLVTCVLLACAFSSVASLAFLLVGAPDVALAEIVIGSALSTIMYLVALQRYKIFTIYYIPLSNSTGHSQLDQILPVIVHSVSAHDLQPHLILSFLPISQLFRHYHWDLIVEETLEGIIIHLKKHNQYAQALTHRIAQEHCGKLVVLTDAAEEKEWNAL